jgi:hypothetical protein
MLKIIKVLGITLLVVLILFLWLISSLFAQPLHVLLTTTVISMVLYRMLKRENCWCRIVVVGIFIIVGVWYVFHNDIPGPMKWRISDRPIDTPSQWLDCYRFYWCGDVIYTTSLIGGVISFALIFIVRLISKSKHKCKSRVNNEMSDDAKENMDCNREKS